MSLQFRKEISILDHHLFMQNSWQRNSILDSAVDYVCTPIYKPKVIEWEATFRALGFKRITIEKFWSIFYRVNKAKNGSMTMYEFLNYFDLDRSLYVEKCFEYFDVSGGETIDFLEFVISVWNICTLKNDTLTNFTFELYNLNGSGEISLPEIERMVHELYGQGLENNSSIGKAVLKDVVSFAEDRGGVLNLTSFTIYTANHSLLLLPAFKIQRQIQNKVLGISYWSNLERTRPRESVNKERNLTFDPYHARNLLKKFKEGGSKAMMEFCADKDLSILQVYKMKEMGEDPSRNSLQNVELKRDKFKSAVNKVREMNHEQKDKLRRTVLKVGVKAENSIETAAAAFVDAGIRSKRALVRMASGLKEATNPLPREAHGSYTLSKNAKVGRSWREEIARRKQERLKLKKKQQKLLEQKKKAPTIKPGQRHKERKKRPKSAPSPRVKKQDNPSNIIPMRPRTPGNVVSCH